MNIGQLLRTVMGDVAPGDPKALELKIGQVVKGLVLKLLSEQDALVNIGGTVVRARLEVPLQQGQVTFLQVQPESAGGQIVMKPLSDSEVPLPGDGAALLLKSLGLPDRPEERQAAQLLHIEGVALSRDHVEGLAKVLQAKPATVGAEEWKTAALLAMKKNLPLTMDTVASLRAAVFEPPVHEAATRLAGQLTQLLQSGELPTGSGVAGAARQLVAGVEALRGQAAALLEEALGGSGGTSSTEAASVKSDASRMAGAGGDARPNVVSGSDTAYSPLASAPSETTRGSAAGTPLTPPPSVSAQLSSPASLVGDEPAAAPMQANTAEQLLNPSPASGIRADEQRGNPAPASGQSAPAPLSDPDAANAGKESVTSAEGGQDGDGGQGQASGLLKGLLKLLGTDHEAKWSRFLLQDGPTSPSGELPSDQTGTGSPTATDSQQSLKSALLQLVAAGDDLPQSVHDAAQQLLQQVTGTQLMLAPDPSVPFTQITMTLPLMQTNGAQTAAIHIQARAGKRGELDAANCRLLFDLQMKTLGLTLVDVRVVDRMVSLEVRNDMEPARAWFERYRDEIDAALKSAGYQLVSLKSLPFPEAVGNPGPANGDSNGGQAALNRIASRYQAKPYKGVDIRV